MSNQSPAVQVLQVEARRATRARVMKLGRSSATLLAALTLAWPAFAAEDEADEGRAGATTEERALDADEAEGASPAAPEEGPLPEDENLAAPDELPRPQGVEVIKVTAERREEFVQDVPISMVALDEEFLEVTNLTQFNRLQQRIIGGRQNIRARHVSEATADPACRWI